MAGSARARACTLLMTVLSERCSGRHREMLDDGTERERREVGEAADDQDHADQQADKQSPLVGKVPSDGGTIFLAASDPAAASIGIIIRKRPTSIAMPSVEL